MQVRDEFTAATKRTLAARVGYCCSNPDCRVPTVGPQHGDAGYVNLGVAAHITAASVGGPRYDHGIGPDNRKDGENGIWLCLKCARLIDVDPKAYTIELLKQWKVDAVKQAFEALSSQRGDYRATRPGGFEVDIHDNSFINGLGLPSDQTPDHIAEKFFEVVKIDLSKFRATKEWPKRPVELGLKYHAQPNKVAISLQGLAQALTVAQAVNILSDPGSGKSTTLVQLAEALINEGRMVPVLIPLGEWSDRKEPFFEAVIRHKDAFSGYGANHLKCLAYDGRLVFILDGWNELDDAARLTAARDLKKLSREYPMLCWIISSRPQEMPIDALTVEVSPLTDEQQLQIAEGMRGADGEGIVDRAWRTPGVRELITIPLYLSALLKIASLERFPATKEEILRSFVRHIERDTVKSEILRATMNRRQDSILAALAEYAANIGRTFITQDNALRIIAEVAIDLAAKGQIGTVSPPDILDTLVKHHILVAASGEFPGVSFQHPQFLEWYASSHIEAMMQRAHAGDSATRDKLKVEVYNEVRWEESILFATERLARMGPSEASALALAILDTLNIDPMFAADMIYRSTDAVWALVRDQVIAFATNWHTAGKIDRAVRFMITTGRDEFTPQIWPLVSNPDTQVFLRALRAADRFRPSVLGADAEKKLRELPDDVRQGVVSEIASRSAFDGMELATKIAISDPSSSVVVSVVHSLRFRRGDRHVIQIMKHASEEVWREIAERGYPETLLDAELDARLTKIRGEIIATGDDPVSALSLLLESRRRDAEAQETITRIVASPSFMKENQQGAHNLLYMAHKQYPVAVAKGLLRRMEEGLDLDYHSDNYLADAPMVDDGPITERILSGKKARHKSGYECHVIGPNTTGILMDRYLVAAKRLRNREYPSSQEAQDEYFTLRDQLAKTRDEAFYPPFLTRAATNDLADIEEWADLLNGRNRRRKQSGGDNSSSHEAMVEIAKKWIDVALKEDVDRHAMSRVASAAGFIGDERLLPGLDALLRRDLDAWTAARTAWLGKPTMPVPSDVNTSHEYQYRDAFIGIGGSGAETLLIAHLRNPEFGVGAAVALNILWRNHQNIEDKPNFGRYYDYGGVIGRRKERTEGIPPTSPHGDTILNAAMDIVARHPGNDKMLRHAFGLARVGFLMPHGNRRNDLEALLALPVDYEVKLQVMRSAAMAGEVLPAEELLAGVQALVADTKNSWKLNRDSHSPMDWCELFAFSDRPGAVLEALMLLPDMFRHPRKMERIFYAFSKRPDRDAISFLAALPDWNVQILENGEWLDAVKSFKSVESLKVILALLEQGKRPARAPRFDINYLGRDFGQLAEANPAVLEELLRQYQTVKNAHACELIETAFAELEHGDDRIVLAMVRRTAAEKRAMDYKLSRAVERAAVGRRPVPGWVNGYEQFSSPIPSLRRELYAMVLAQGPEAKIATACLKAIEKYRDEHGRIAEEPRHPDISAGGQWPL